MGNQHGDAVEWASGMSALLGHSITERYRLLRRIADGGMGSVWCGRDQTLDRDVAIKLLAERYLDDQMAVRRFKREARAAALLSGHPNVVTIFDVGETTAEDEGGQPFIVMEYLAGGTVADALRLGELTRHEAVTWLGQAAAALDYAHRRGVVHRDIKLSNLLLDRGRVLHVGDFGIARVGTDDTLTGTGEVIGTAAYLAPERALGQPATEASDRYALGVAAYELLVGERPFAAENFARLSRQHLEDPLPDASARNPTLPRRLDAVLARAMAKRPEERWPTAQAFAEAIVAALEPGSVRSGAVPLTPMTRSPGGRRSAPRRIGGVVQPGASRARIAAPAALAVALVALAVALAAGGGSPTPARSGGTAAAHAARARAPARPPTQPPAQPQITYAADTPSSATPQQLEARGHALMTSGDYHSAIPVLRRAVAAAPAGTLTHAYALYDLGRSLLESGDPRAAIPILRARLAIPNQTAIVAATLQAAIQAAGQGGPTASTGETGGGAKHGQNQGGDGGGD